MFVRELSNALCAETLARSLAGSPGLAWLDSDGSAAADARFSFVTAAPCEIRRTELPAEDAVTGDAGEVEAHGPFHAFEGLGSAGPDSAAESGDEGASGAQPRARAVPHWIGYVAYDAYSGRASAKAPRRRGAAVVLARYAAVFVLDHHRGRTFVVGDDEAACERLLASSHAPPTEIRASAGALNAADPAEHARAIARALGLISRGDLYQVNLARKFWAPWRGHPLALALAMRQQSPVPLGMFFDDGERSVVSRSMERFLRWERRERRLHTRPIKGTLARLGDDSAERSALLADAKEHAEHAMIVDLMRNDLGRVAEIGSVQVLERMRVEPFARLHHLVSTITCTTRSEIGASDILHAMFPPGSVTGTPKLRAVETIAALEAAPRGIYTGALGFVDRAGGLSLSVAIRTAVVEAGQASYFAGGGIVEASDIEREIAETELKARVFVDALRALA